MEQKRPADIFQEALDYLWNGLGLEEKGWKRLKKGAHDNFLIIRDYLRSHNDEADQYSKIKYQYAKQANYDRSAYKKLKAAYVDKLLQRARQWKNGG